MAERANKSADRIEAVDGEAAARADILARAERIVPVLRDRAAKAEALRRMPDETVADLVAVGLTRTSQPARFGGYELGWDIVCEVSMVLGRGDASQAWVGNIYAEHAFMAALFPDEAQREVWGNNPEALISTSVVPMGNRAEAVDGGYILEGRWPFVSGVDHSDWTIIGEIMHEAGAPPRHLFFLVPRADLAIDDDWNAAGMAGTGSKAVVLDKVFVPAHRTLANEAVAAGAAPGAAVNRNPLYRMPFFGFSNLALASVLVGAAEGMIDDFGSFVAQRAARKPVPPALEALYTRLSEAAAEAKAARLMILDAAAGNMAKLRAGAHLTAADGTRSMHQNAYACVLARRAAARLQEASGAHGIYLSNAMQRAFRDIYAGAVHTGLNWDRHALNYGRMVTVGR
jgi:3-hydroxy-9,10-secoandrosta-1,3,5(10)-triene-9,17-dione monooxygenase